MAQFDEFLVMGAEYAGNNADDFTDGLLIFWDGTSEDFNFFIKVEEGGVQTLLPIKNRLYFIAGIRGELFATDGEDYVKVKRFPKTSDVKYIKTMFASSTIYRGIPAFGMAFDTDNSTFEKGVYSYGAKDNIYDDVLTYDYPISSGTRTPITLKIGSVRAYGSDMFIAWDDNSTFGVDIVNASSNPFTTATYESLLYDAGFPYIQKFVGVIRVDHQALLSNETIQIGYDIDQSGSFTTDTANSTTGSTETRFPVNKLFRDIAVQVNVTNTTTSPQINAITLDIEDNMKQADAI